MEDKKAKIIAAAVIASLIAGIVVARLSLKLSEPFYVIAGAGTAAIIAVFAILLLRHGFDRRRRLLETQMVSEGRELRIEYSFLRKVAGVPTKFRERELEEATDGFTCLVGKGSSACVFKGILSDGTAVAVKRIEGEERGEREFRSEVAAIASVQHVNLVRLLGYCSVPAGKRFLVYEFIPNGSLDKWIFPPRREAQPQPQGKTDVRGGCLAWDLRWRVAIDVARALSYLHHDCRSRILHLDVKPENILLDGGYRALVSDFGLSKLMGRDESRIVTTIRGTKGYLAPEWLLGNGVSEKSDIYSYGMVLFELIGGRRNVSVIEDINDKSKRKFQYFPKIVREKLREGKLMEAVDSRLLEGGGVDEREVRRLVHVALWCVQEKARLRPTMAQVVEMLEGRVQVDEPPDTQMIIIDLLSIDKEEEEQNPSRDRQRLAATRVNSDVASSSTYSYSMSVLSGR
ncbi:probable receptor-like protein kinase At5g20050 [Actinidia eriantha]|uniref:probable receptor-like protein kinase At5g20050 n=1 Tax=Actinidia eriantha TaxID=165200 RepID=UPI002589C8E7|nr:probable receptor-like protein kinase At5g20050 [Actinidia eriantha]